MLKALIKKQFAELGAVYAFNKKTGKQRSHGAVVGLAILLAFCAVSIGFAFFGMGMLFASNFVPLGLDWFYFAMMGMIAVAVATIGEVFATYSMLYNAKDNELLLSMPIPSRTILLSRMVTLYIMSVIFTAIVFVPAMIAYWLNASPSALSVIFCILLLFVLALIALMLSCLLGWIVAMIASRIKGNKAVISVIVSVLLIGLYYVVYFRMNTLLKSAVANADQLSSGVKSYVIPFYHMGLAAAGNPLYMLLFTAGTVILFVLVWLLISRNFIRIVTGRRAESTGKYERSSIKTGSVSSALLDREFKHFTSSAAYMLNTGIGLIIMLALAVVCVIKSGALRGFMQGFTEQPIIPAMAPAALTVAMFFLLAMNLITAPSVSLEGKNIWILQTMPVDAKYALRAKQYMHLILNGAVCIIAAVLINIAFGIGALDAALMTCCSLAFIWLVSAFGLAINIKKPMLDWTNETVPVKQGMSVLFTMLFGWAFAIVFGLLAFLVGVVLNGGAGGVRIYMACMLVLELAVAYLITRWIDTKGARIFEKL